MRNTDPSADAICDILDDLHGAIRRADLAALAPLAGDLDAALDRMNQPDAAGLERLRARADRNLSCLEAAARGLRAARRRVADVTAAAQGVGTYDAMGRRNLIGPPAPGLRHRA